MRLEDASVNCRFCGKRLNELVALRVQMGGPQICGPCIDKGNRQMARLDHDKRERAQRQRMNGNADETVDERGEG